MADLVSSAVRSRMMAGIRNKDTKPELILRRGLHRLGFRFRLHRKDMPGNPDLVFPKHRAVLFVHGCFWHGHECHIFKWPKSRENFWRSKIEANKRRDVASISALTNDGWRVGTVWECAFKGKFRRHTPDVIQACASWLDGTARDFSVSGNGLSKEDIGAVPSE